METSPPAVAARAAASFSFREILYEKSGGVAAGVGETGGRIGREGFFPAPRIVLERRLGAEAPEKGSLAEMTEIIEEAPGR